MKDLELVIFDMDGLMFDTEKIAYRTWETVVRQLGYAFDFEFFQTMLGSNLTRINELCFKKYGNDFPVDQIKEMRYQLTKDIISQEGVPFKKGLVELLIYLKQIQIKTAVATSSGKDRANIFLKPSEITHYFDYIICGDEITKSKPDPEIFLTVAKKLSCEPEHTIVLEDSEAGIIAADAGNFIPIMVPDLKQPSIAVLAKTFKCFESLIDVKNFLME